MYRKHLDQDSGGTLIKSNACSGKGCEITGVECPKIQSKKGVKVKMKKLHNCESRVKSLYES
jgi:hypothetical protein